MSSAAPQGFCRAPLPPPTKGGRETGAPSHWTPGSRGRVAGGLQSWESVGPAGPSEAGCRPGSPKQQRGRVPGRASARNAAVPLLTLTLQLYLGRETEPMQLQTEAAACGSGRERQMAHRVPLAPLPLGMGWHHLAQALSQATAPRRAGQELGSLARQPADLPEQEQGPRAAQRSRTHAPSC